MIDRLYGELPRLKVDTLVDNLNRADDKRLSAVWEVAFLDAFARHAGFEYEKELANGRTPDLGELRWHDGDTELQLIGDITTISDRGLHEANPIDWLRQEIHRRATRRRLDGRKFAVKVEGRYKEPESRKPDCAVIFGLKDAKPSLLLGPKKKLNAILDARFEGFLKQVADAPATEHVFAAKEDKETKFTVTYRPDQRHTGGGHLSYTVAGSLRRNPLYNALEDKAGQLKAAPADALRMVVVCDSGCRLLGSYISHADPVWNFSAAAIAKAFLNGSRTVDVVLLVGVKVPRSVYDGPKTLRFVRVVADPDKRAPRLTPGALDSLYRMLDAIEADWPPIALDPLNAARFALKENFWPADMGLYSVSSGPVQKITLSARVLQQLLAGEITSEQFITQHDWDKPGCMKNPFREATTRGQMIAQVLIQPHPERDDDAIEFTLKGGDAANGPFLKRAAASELKPTETE